MTSGYSAKDLVEWGQETLAAESKALADGAKKVGDAFAGAVQAILASSGKVIVTGLGKSGHVARKIASTLSSTGTSAFFLHPSEALHGDFGMMQRSDCLIAIAYGGETHEVLEVCRFARRIGVPVIGITGNLESTLARLSQFLIDSRVEKEADPLNLAPTTSSTMAVALGDAFAVTLMRARGFSKGDFASLHPGGSLGRKLSLVKDHMHTGENLPRTHEHADFHEVLSGVTAHNFGIVAITNQAGDLVGAVSDGDLRRALLKLGAKALTCTAKDLMSANPKVIAEGVLALDALTLMNDKRVTQLFVTQDVNSRKPTGIVRLHDLLAAKIL